MISVSAEINKTIETIELLLDSSFITITEKISDICEKSLRSGNKILFAGNGGSAADAQHLAAELVSRLNFDRKGLASIALTTDTSVLTAIGNDYGFENVFSRQIEAIGQKGDVLIAISTSGNSLNIINAIETAKSLGITVIGKTGQSGGKMANLCDLILKIPSSNTQKIQECHIILGHIYAGLIEERMFL